MSYLGELSALTAALLWSFSSFLFTAVAIRIGTLQLNITRIIFALILLAITILVFNVNYDIKIEQLILLSVSGVIGLVIGDTYLFRSFKEIGPRISMLIMSCNPAIAAILAYIILGEIISIWGILGIIITISGISLVVMEKPKEEKTKFKITKKGIVYSFIGAAGQGVGIVVAKMAFQYGDIHSLTATFVRIASSLIVLLPIAIILKKFDNPIKLFSKDKKALGLVFLASIIGPYLGITLSFISIIYTKVGIASTLMSSTPILMLPLAYFIYKEKLSWKSITGAFISFIGIGILFLI